MDKIKKFLPCIIIVVVASSIAFYSGFLCGKNSAPNVGSLFGNEQASRQNGGNMPNGFSGKNAGTNGGMTIGEIISKDDKSITIKIADGGSKIIFFSDSTKISKSATATADELKIGEQISANGVSNSDGSITAQSIQLGVSRIIPAQQKTQ